MDGDDADGVRTIWIKWADHHGEWSETTSDSIVLDRGIPRGTVSIAGGAAWTSSSTVTVATPIADPSAVSAVQLSNNGTDWVNSDSAPSRSWALAAGAADHVPPSPARRSILLANTDDRNRSA
jgi:hypothetical protein